MTVGKQSATFWVAIVCAAGIALGSLGPWATALFVSRSGVSGDGKFTLVAGVFAALMLVAYSQNDDRTGPVLAGVCALVAGALGVYRFRAVESSEGVELFERRVDVIEVGWGLYVVVLASAALLFTSWLLFNEQAPRKHV